MDQNAKENLARVSDGRLYGLQDMVKVGCHDCAGCSLCCRDMGNSIILDPYDAFRITKGLGQSFEELLQGFLELHVEDGLILPNLKMQTLSDRTTACSFLNTNGRCSIHSLRPGLCRIFPLGRNYEEDRITYFLLMNECPAENKTKIKVSKWIDTDSLRENQEYLIRWHSFIKKVRALISTMTDDALMKQFNMALLHIFYLTPYICEGNTFNDFYAQFLKRMEKAESLLA